MRVHRGGERDRKYDTDQSNRSTIRRSIRRYFRLTIITRHRSSISRICFMNNNNSALGVGTVQSRFWSLARRCINFLVAHTESVFRITFK